MTHGPDAIAELVREGGTSYPISVSQLEREHALDNVQIDERGNSMMVGELLAEVETDRFEDEEDLRASLEPAFEAERERRNTGIIGTIKELVLGTYTR